MQFDNLLGEPLEKAKKYISDNNLSADFLETKDRFNTYDIKRVIRVIRHGEKLEILYTGFPQIGNNNEN